MFEPSPAEDAFYIRAVARAQKFHGERIADSLLSHLLNRISSEPEIVEGKWRDVYCHIHWKNIASRRLFKRFGFECIGHADDLETWALDLASLTAPEGAPPAEEDAEDLADA